MAEAPASETRALVTGRFITFEGGEGAGKSTQCRMLADALRQSAAVVQTREPGGAPNAERVRDLLLQHSEPWSPLAETLLHFAARAEHVAKTIRPALQNGQWVVCDRFVDSTMAYQGAGQAEDRQVIETLAGLIGLQPDLTIVLTVPAELRAQRLAARGQRLDRYEAMPPSFHDAVNAAFDSIARANPDRCVLIDGSAGADVVHQAIRTAVQTRLGWP